MITKEQAKEAWNLSTTVSYGMSKKAQEETFAILDEYFTQPAMSDDDAIRALNTIEGQCYQDYAGDPFPVRLKEDFKEEIHIIREVIQSVQPLQELRKKAENKLKELLRLHTDDETGEKYYQFHVDGVALLKELLNEK